MANEEQLAILKQGVEVWNKWREENPSKIIDLHETNLMNWKLRGARLRGANLKGANLQGAQMMSVDLSEAILSNVDLRGAFLVNTNFSLAVISEANFSSATLASANFGNVDMSEAIGLDEVIHHYPSTIGTDTITISKGRIPEVFLQGCGLSNWEIENAKLYNPDLNNDEITKIQYRVYELRATQALQISPLFISYSHGDSKFVDKVETHLNTKGIRFWRDKHDMKAGRVEKQIDRAMRLNPTVLLILSENSTNSDWVEHEVRTARELEKALGRDTLCPVALDDSWKDSPWPKRVMEQVMEYNILDFSEWEDQSVFERQFKKLLDGLDLFYK